MDLIKLNPPDFFAPEEAEDLSRNLDEETVLFDVLLLDKKIVGCGGINFEENKTNGKISRDIIHSAFQRISLGKNLLRPKIEALKTIDSMRRITVRTSQGVYKSYE